MVMMMGITLARPVVLLYPQPPSAKALNLSRRSLLGRDDELGEELADEQVNEKDEEMYVGDMRGKRSKKMPCES
jgi:hypothetical protein